jgi:hypothetical protein
MRYGSHHAAALADTGPARVEEDLRHRCRIVEPFEIRVRREVRRFNQVEIEIAGAAGNCLVPSPIQETGNGQPLEQMLALKRRFEVCLASGAAIIEDRKNPRLRSHRYFAATTMISTL